MSRPGRVRCCRDDERASIIVVEAVLVAIIVLTAILFFTSVQRPTRVAQEGSASLAQVATDTLAILRAHTVLNPADGTSMGVEAWTGRLLAGDASTAADVDDFVSQLIPAGARYAIRLNNGVQPVGLLPIGGAGSPAGAQAAETPLMPVWKVYAGNGRTLTDAVTTNGSPSVTSATAGFTAADVGKAAVGSGIALGTTVASVTSPTAAVLSAAATATASGVTLTIDPRRAAPGAQVFAGHPLYSFTQNGSIKCIRSPAPDPAAPTQGAALGPSGASWVSLWQGQVAGKERVPPNAPYGIWAGYPNADCSGTPLFGRVMLETAPRPDDYALYGLQLVVWYGA